MDDVPSKITPSVGTFAPGFTKNTSFFAKSFTGISISLLSLTTIAVLGASPMSFWMAEPTRPFERASKYLPNTMKDTSAADDSQKG